MVIPLLIFGNEIQVRRRSSPTTATSSSTSTSLSLLGRNLRIGLMLSMLMRLCLLLLEPCPSFFRLCSSFCDSSVPIFFRLLSRWLLCCETCGESSTLMFSSRQIPDIGVVQRVL